MKNNHNNHIARYGLKFHPFRPDIPNEALYVTAAVDSFARRVDFGVNDGGFAMVTGDPGTGKSVALRVLQQRLDAHREVVVGTIEHPQSRITDFYRELGDRFGVAMPSRNRWGGFKALRARWSEHIATTLMRPVLILDEAQEVLSSVLGELRILASQHLDSRQLLCVIMAGDGRLVERLRSPELLPLGSRIRRRLVLDYASPADLMGCLEHLLEAAGNPALMSDELKVTLTEHAAGNYRVLMNICDELLVVAAERELPCLDEKLYLETFSQPKQTRKTKRRRR